MPDHEKPSELIPLYGVWINKCMQRIQNDVNGAIREAETGLKSGNLTPLQKTEVEQALRHLQTAARELTPNG